MTVHSSAEVYFQAGNKINLKPGFRVNRGAYFNASIEDCSFPRITHDYSLLSDSIKHIELMNMSALESNEDSLENINSNYLSIYPNPTNEILNIYSIDKINEIYVYNSFGELIYQTNVGMEHFEFKMNHFSKGIYVFRIETSHDSILKKVVLN